MSKSHSAIEKFKNIRKQVGRSRLGSLPTGFDQDPLPPEGRPALDIYRRPKPKRQDLHTHISEEARAVLDELLADLRRREGRGKNMPDVLEPALFLAKKHWPL